MRNLLYRLWEEDRGSVVTSELVLVSGLVVLGSIPVLVSMRDATNYAITKQTGIIADVTEQSCQQATTVIGQPSQTISSPATTTQSLPPAP